MKQRAKWQMLIVLFVLCVCMLLGVFSLNNGFSSTNVFADESTSSSIEEYLTFSLFNNGTEYKVTARNKSITEIKIPYKYNDIPVTEISDNAFMGCSNLKEIWIPYTVKRIGNNAFANCRNLEIVNGMSRVENIGNNAFALCPKLNNLILPNTINSLGSTILRNNTNTIYSRKAEAEMTALNSSWKSSSTAIIIYGNELVLDEVYAEDGITVAGYRIEMVQNLNEEVDFVLGDTYNGLPLLEINEWAFSGNRFSSFTLKHGEIVPDSEDVGTQHLLNDNDSSCNHVVNIQSGVFLGANIPYIDLLVDVSFNNVGLENFGFLDFEKDLSSDIFAGSTELIRVTLPDNITYIPRSAFNGCSNLREIVSTNLNIDVNHLSDNITKIGTEAFSGCYSLINLYIPQSITTMGNAVFNQWGDSLNSIVNQTIYLDFYEPPVGKTGYNWDQDWLGTIYEKANVQFKTIQITFDKDGGKADVGTNEVQAMLNQDMPEALAPERNHYTFKGYYSERNGNGTKYYDENMNSVTAWDKQTSTILYAYWIPDTYIVTFDKQGGTGGSNSVIASYEQAMPTATAPEKTGYRFLGYYYANPTGTDIQYYDGNMVSVKSWNISRNTTLYAKWGVKEYTVILNQDGGVDGQNYFKVKYDEEMPEIQEPHKTGYTFSGYYTEQNGQGTKYYNADMTSAKNWDIDQDNISLYAYWTPTSYTITFDKQGGIGGTDEVDSVYYQGDLPEGLVAPTREGYIFKGYFAEVNGEGRKYYNSDMTAAYIYDVDTNLSVYAGWDLEVYTIIYDLDGGINNTENPSTYTVEDSIVLKDATHETLIFDGWLYNGELITSLDGITGNIILVAKWTDIRTIHITEPFTTLTIRNPKVVLIFDTYFDTNCEIIVETSCIALGINGNGHAYKMNIDIEERTTEFSLLLNNIAIMAHSQVSTINVDSEATLHLYTYQTVIIKGTYKQRGNYPTMIANVTKDGTPAISCNKLIIHSADNLIIQGGDALKASWFGVDGGNGGVGILANSEVYILCSNVTVAGGLATDGTNAEPDAVIPALYRGEGGKGAYPIAGKSSSPTVNILEGVQNVFLYKSSDGEPGEGPQNPALLDPAINPPTDIPEPVIPPENPILPPIVDDLVLPPWDDNIIPPPTDPVIPPIIDS